MNGTDGRDPNVGMNVQSRDEALRDFREDSSIRVLLMSLKAGGVALNLTVANEAYLLDRKYYWSVFSTAP